MPEPPYPKNVPGPFYVENQCCIMCTAPWHEAKDLMEHDEEESYAHCFFKKQPETPEETERAIMACVVSCVQAVRYSGDDPVILQRFQELRSEISCDVFHDPSLGSEDGSSLKAKLSRMQLFRGSNGEIPSQPPPDPDQFHLLRDEDMHS